MKKTISLMIMACMLLLAACDNYLDIQPTGSVIPNSLAEYRALLARSYKDPTLKRIRPRAKGSASRINKRTCHITIVVAPREEA